MTRLPAIWELVPIEQLCDVNPRVQVDLTDSQPVSFVPMPAVDEVSGEIARPVDRPLREVLKGFTQFREGDVIFAKITPCMENGKSAVARSLTNGLGYGSTEFHVFRSKGAVRPDYLWRYLRRQSFRDDAAAVMTGAVGQRRVPTDFMKSHKLPLPPLAEQRRIVAKLECLTARTARARSELDHIPRLVEKYKQAILAKAFSYPVDAKASSSGVVQLRTAIRELVTGPFGSALHKSDYVTGEIPIINPMHINDGLISPSAEMSVSEKKAQELSAFRLCPGDVIIARRGKMGRCAVVSDEQEGWLCGTGSMILRPSANLLSDYLFLFLSSPRVISELESEAVGTTMVNLNQKILLGLTLEVPALPAQMEIVRSVRAAWAWLDKVAAEHARASHLVPKLDQSILAKAFRGELVPQDPNDEPASVLLDRIKREQSAATTGSGKSRSGRRSAK